MGLKRNISRVLVGKERDYLEGLRVDGKVVLKCILPKYDGVAWTGFSWIRSGKSSMNTAGFHRLQGISRLDEEQLSCQE